MTKYDRKMEARRQQEAKEKKDKLRARIIGVAVVALILVAVLSTTLSSVFAKKAALNETYVKVGNHELSEVEYDYYYSYMVNQWLTTYSAWVPYMGLDTSADFAQQQYSDTMTWKDFFDDMTLEQIQNVKALSDEINEIGWTQDVTAEYKELTDSLEAAAKEANVDLDTYYQAAYGPYASESTIKPFAMENLLVNAYILHLNEENTPDEETVTAYYEEHKNDYDLVDYYAVSFEAEVDEDVEEDAEDEAMATAMEAQKELADEMAARLEAGEDFETLCLEYFPEDVEEADEEEEEDAEEDSEVEEKDAHLKDDYLYAYADSSYQDWLYDENRKAGDVIVVEDTDSDCYHVVKFVERVYDEDCPDTISNKLVNEAVSDYIKALTQSYEIVDVKGELKCLTIPEEEEEDTEE